MEIGDYGVWLQACYLKVICGGSAKKSPDNPNKAQEFPYKPIYTCTYTCIHISRWPLAAPFLIMALIHVSVSARTINKDRNSQDGGELKPGLLGGSGGLSKHG